MIKIVSTTGISSFQWTTSEQVYPFEKGNNGETLYARRFDFTTFSAPAWISAAHGQAGNSNFKAYKLFGDVYSPNWAGPKSLVPAGNYIVQDNLGIGVYSQDELVVAYIGGGYSTNCTAKIYLIYSKE